ncbi:hypothetical protein ACFO4P_12970 [Epilithonimonas pallida]|uniref:Uncharacterized protein n=1 Tax=Epilithonimonas pallida TaxID=373671 RepID=A0ABY1R824_9FLAO|nr:hypothetical protein [Epilithonimonas pallida]SMP95470.1 hypothetical protein SAMN05421679_107140 [Epilithonimonas pallida]
MAALFFIPIIIPAGKVFSKLGLYLLHIQKKPERKVNYHLFPVLYTRTENYRTRHVKDLDDYTN